MARLWWLAIVLLVSAVGLFAQKPKVDTWGLSSTAGAQALSAQNYPEAERQFKIAITAAEAFGPNDARLAVSLNDLGMLYYRLGRYQEAEAIFVRAVSVWEQAKRGKDGVDFD